LVLSYVSFNNELDLSAINNHLIREKKLILPGMIGNEIVLYQVLDMKNLQKHRLGFLQPDPNKCPLIANSLVQLAFIPGLGFDKSNKNRLGYGQGHYDCFLPHLEKAKFFGVGFKEQEIHSFPIEEHDIAMHEVYLF